MNKLYKYCLFLPILYVLQASAQKQQTILTVPGKDAYTHIEHGLTENNGDSVWLPFHPYGDNTLQSINGYTYNGRKVPVVGSPLAPEAMSVYTIDLATNAITDKFKPGP